MKYRPEIDGLRAIAVVPVIFFHAGFVGFSGGFVGVDVFFVISGYLITNIIYEDIQKRRYSILNFYERRARRILPALFVVCFACIPFAYLWMVPSNLKEFSQSLIAVNLFVSNVLFWHESGYFDTAVGLKPLIHTWSLAIEEQFYLFFPIFLLIFRKLSRFRLAILVAATSLASLAIAEYLSRHHPSANFYLLPSRAWELGLGSLASLALERNRIDNAIVRQMGSLAGLVLIGFAIFSFDETTRFPSVLALIPDIGAVLVIACAGGGEIAGRVLSWKPLVVVGLISYSAYLWHQPLFAFARMRSLFEPTAGGYLALIAVTFALAYLSWSLVESPFRNRRVMSVRAMTAWIAPVTACVVSFGVFGVVANGMPQRMLMASAKEYEPDNKLLQINSWTILRSLTGQPDYARNDNASDQKLWFDDNDKRSRLLIVGNSHSKDLFNDLYYSNHSRSKYQIARYGTQISNILSNSSAFFTSKNYRNAQIVVLATRYSIADVDAIPQIVRRIKKDHKQVVLVKNVFEFKDYGQRNLADVLIWRLSKTHNLATDAGVVSQDIDRTYFVNYVDFDTYNKNLRDLNNRIGDIAAREAVTVLDRMDYICSMGADTCYAIDDNYKKYFYDYGHHTLAGAVFFGGRIDSTNWLRPIDYLMRAVGSDSAAPLRRAG